MLTILCANTSFAQVDYSTLNYSGGAMGSSTFLTGIRGAGGENVYITGFYTLAGETNGQGLFYQGLLDGSGDWILLNFPSSVGLTVTSTTLYGPDTLTSNNVRLVGSYKKTQTGDYDNGLLYEGPPDGSGTWETIDFPSTMTETVLDTLAHSTSGGLVVGNYDTDLAMGKAFVYDINGNSWVELVKPGAVSITAYGIWYNGGTQYTIAGGYSDANIQGIDHGYLVDWDSATQTTSNWTSYDYRNRHRIGVDVSHFNGITSDDNGGFYLTGVWVGVIPPNAGAFFAHVRRMPNRRAFGDAHWTKIGYPPSPGLTVDATTGNSVFENNVIGIYTANGLPSTQGFVGTVRGHR